MVFIKSLRLITKLHIFVQMLVNFKKIFNKKLSGKKYIITRNKYDNTRKIILKKLKISIVDTSSKLKIMIWSNLKSDVELKFGQVIFLLTITKNR